MVTSFRQNTGLVEFKSLS